MDYAWCFGSGDWAQTQSDPTGTGGFFDENINHLQWNSSTCNTPAPLVPDSTPFTFGLEMGLTNELPFSDGFSYASQPSCDLDSLFGHESASVNWDSGCSGETSGLPNQYMSLPASSNSDYFATLPPELEVLLPTADSSLGDDLPVSSLSPPTVDLAQHEISDSEAQTFLG
ncbi:hypothetical protein B0H13DRAFT_2414230 [Mycena leptocephala]|nr:hypothetical protein B0H13DRAFT_2414230 [Mycena leptocephala]